MAKREKIIVVIMILTILYGVYAFFIAPSSKRPKSASISTKVKRVDANKLVGDVSKVLKDDDSAIVDTYIIARAEEEWAADPFYTEKGSSGHTGEVKLVYTGYLEIGKKKIAIINGVDYQIGDELEMTGYKIISINPSRVVVVDKRGRGKITVPLLEE
ncbi:MAG: hypothetical protein U9M96_04005 [Thermodesulfobacteriota bacterium]|nr:hypothetical protein [Thermodesulfobacteriota bacterium]